MAPSPLLPSTYGDTVGKAIADGLFKLDRDPNQLLRVRRLLPVQLKKTMQC
jgi:hypothetical protein